MTEPAKLTDDERAMAAAFGMTPDEWAESRTDAEAEGAAAAVAAAETAPTAPELAMAAASGMTSEEWTAAKRPDYDPAAYRTATERAAAADRQAAVIAEGIKRAGA